MNAGVASEGSSTLADTKNLVYKNQRWEPIHQKQKANESTRRHNPKKKQKKIINKKKGGETLYKQDSWLQNDDRQQQRRPKTRKLSFVTNQLVMEVH